MLIMLNRASKRNAVDRHMAERLYSTMKAFESTSSSIVSVKVLYTFNRDYLSDPLFITQNFLTKKIFQPCKNFEFAVRFRALFLARVRLRAVL